MMKQLSEITDPFLPIFISLLGNAYKYSPAGRKTNSLQPTIFYADPKKKKKLVPLISKLTTEFKQKQKNDI